MTTFALDLCLALAVLSVWLGSFSFLRLRSTLDRLHCTTFVLASSGPLLALTAFFEEGLTTRFLKLIALVVVLLVTSAATTHAVGRAIYLRDGPQA